MGVSVGCHRLSHAPPRVTEGFPILVLINSVDVYLWLSISPVPTIRSTVSDSHDFCFPFVVRYSVLTKSKREVTKTTINP